MRGMEPGGRFFDTDVLLYTQDHAEAFKQSRALAVIADAMRADCFVISTQVMQEFYSEVLHRRWLSPAQALQFLRHLTEHVVVSSNSDSVLRAFELQQRHGLSPWDALLVQSALDARCSVLFSEGLPDGQRFTPLTATGPELRVVNPFTAHAVVNVWELHEEPLPYQAAPPKKRTSRALR